MCGRFTQNYTWEEVYAFLNVFGTPRNLRPRYNVAPTTNIDVIRLDREGRRELVSMRWGLVPYFWKKSLKGVPATFNARAETIAEKPMFRESFKGFFYAKVRKATRTLGAFRPDSIPPLASRCVPKTHSPRYIGTQVSGRS